MTLSDKGHAPEREQLINKAISLILKMDPKQLEAALKIALAT